MRIPILPSSKLVCSCKPIIVSRRSFGVNLLTKRRALIYRPKRRQFRRNLISVSSITPLADVAEGGNLFNTLFVGTVSLVIAVNIGISTLPLLTGATKGKAAGEDDIEEEDGIKWGVMSVVSCLPLLNWLAWVFAAFDDGERAPIYYTNALVYLLPWLSRGFELDSFSVGCLLVGIAHVQLERIAQTEPDTLQLPSPEIVRKPLEKAAGLLGDTTRAYGEVIEENVESSKAKAEDAVIKEMEEMRQRQLKEWDAKLDRRQKDSDKF